MQFNSPRSNFLLIPKKLITLLIQCKKILEMNYQKLRHIFLKECLNNEKLSQTCKYPIVKTMNTGSVWRDIREITVIRIITRVTIITNFEIFINRRLSRYFKQKSLKVSLYDSPENLIILYLAKLFVLRFYEIIQNWCKGNCNITELEVRFWLSPCTIVITEQYVLNIKKGVWKYILTNVKQYKTL